jgi:hypothetical protein
MSDRVAALAERVLKEAAPAGVSWQGGIVYDGGLAALWADRRRRISRQFRPLHLEAHTAVSNTVVVAMGDRGP